MNKLNIGNYVLAIWNNKLYNMSVDCIALNTLASVYSHELYIIIIIAI